MSVALTVLWLVPRLELPPDLDARFRHVVGDARHAGATIARLVGEGPVLAVVGRPEDGERVLAQGVDEVVVMPELQALGIDAFVGRTLARARGRMLRDLYLIDLVRKDDTAALELLAATLGRELSVPLARVSEEARDLLDGPQASPADAHEHAASIARSVESMTRLVEKTQALLDTSPTDEAVDLVDVVRTVADTLSRGMASVATLDVELPPGRCFVGMPRWQLALIVANLVSNGIQSIAARGDGTGRIAISVIVQDGAAVLEVVDDGGGMDPSVRIRAHDLFYSAEAQPDRLGMGLTLVTARVRRAGGDVIMDSSLGEGTTVRVFLPLLSVDQEAPSN